jgi:hypothetical protein
MEEDRVETVTEVEFAYTAELKKVPGQSLGLDLTSDPTQGITIVYVYFVP